ncbi:unnamed protein product [Diabrotica balteata]|uniref:Uncharacterized protein n=1 Tax=Diabrotica balteata TaxID=107213 RepID=A0A9N9XBM6_DIABA|nr:unnamed protein product [Diabrotica balteata]
MVEPNNTDGCFIKISPNIDGFCIQPSTTENDNVELIMFTNDIDLGINDNQNILDIPTSITINDNILITTHQPIASNGPQEVNQSTTDNTIETSQKTPNYVENQPPTYVDQAQDITINYFEPGHTFMSADSFHHQVELSLKKKKKVYDYHDFVKAVKTCNLNRVVVKEMGVSDFLIWKDLSSQSKLKKTESRIYLSQIVKVIVKRESKILHVKIDDSEDLIEMDFLQAKVLKSGIKDPIPVTKPSGIAKKRKEQILKNLGTDNLRMDDSFSCSKPKKDQCVTCSEYEKALQRSCPNLDTSLKTAFRKKRCRSDERKKSRQNKELADVNNFGGLIHYPFSVTVQSVLH